MNKSGNSYLKWTALVGVLAITIIAGVLLVHGHANPPDNKFSVKDASTREGNNNLVRAKRGFELVKDGNNVSARRLNKPLERSHDYWACGCPESQSTGSCSAAFDSKGAYRCSGSCEGCVFVLVTGQ